MKDKLNPTANPGRRYPGISPRLTDEPRPVPVTPLAVLPAKPAKPAKRARKPKATNGGDTGA